MKINEGTIEKPSDPLDGPQRRFLSSEPDPNKALMVISCERTPPRCICVDAFESSLDDSGGENRWKNKLGGRDRAEVSVEPSESSGGRVGDEKGGLFSQSVFPGASSFVARGK